ncbi:MAG: ATP-dependent DNA helicase RecG [Patescibacteria group bacterium]|nr:ATP-dependent DNA helicase RecG [Patescibacteria group bacterium]
MDLTAPIASFPKTTKPLIAALKKLGINTAQDLLFYFPYRYLDFSKNIKIREIKPGESITIQGIIKSIESRFSFRSHMSMAEAIVSDDTGSVKVVWFNQGYLAKTLQKGDEVFLAGTPEYYKNILQLVNPIHEKTSDFPVHTARLVPLYHLSQSVYPKTFRNLVAAVLPLAGQVKETLPLKILNSQKLPDLAETVRFSHFPGSAEEANLAKKRLAFEEIFLNQLLAQKYKLELEQKQAHQIIFDQNLVKKFVSTLPFQLTAAQKKAAWDILQDLEKPRPMNRLLEGDVGSGKTLVAFVAALQTMSQGLQAALLAPTEILARQHFDTALKFLAENPLGQNVRCGLLTNNFSRLDKKETEKKKLAAEIAEGMPGLFIGTHALIQKTVKFKSLALVIIDEQHRFGVKQRSELIRQDGKAPHLLSLTATPIPRTLQLAIYGELDISTIKTKPLGRKPIITKLVHKDNRGKAYDFIGKQILGGRQAFVITPLIEESDRLGVKAAKTEVENLKKIFRNFQIGLMHGRLKGAEKEKVMEDFLANKIQILVSTSVVEVGVDVPNASVMVIEGAERFGLAQLHQFRGRVGRAGHQSFCFLFSEQENPDILSRLEAFTKTQDGFELAELDLKQRGFGQLIGSQQSGWDFKYFNPSYISLIPLARQEAANLLKDDPSLANHPLLQEKVQGKVVHFE